LTKVNQITVVAGILNVLLRNCVGRLIDFINVKKTVVYIHLNGDTHHTDTSRTAKIITTWYYLLPIITSPKCQCAAE